MREEGKYGDAVERVPTGKKPAEFTAQQREAIHGRGNLLVVAGAGTGKTRTLVARAIRLIAEERASFENILMVTFTEAAAAEMRGRIRKELSALQAKRPEDEHLAQQLALLDTARISTLHSFCLLLAREHFHELGLDPQFGILDEQQTRPLMRLALDELLERHYSGTDDAARAVKTLVRTVGRGSDARIRRLIQRLHAYSQSLPNPARWLDEQQRQFTRTEPDQWHQWLLEAVVGWRDEWEAQVAGFGDEAPAIEECLEALGELPANPTLAEAATALRAIQDIDADEESWPRGTKGPVRDEIEGFFTDAEFLASLLPDGNGDEPLAQDWEWTRHHMATLVALVSEFSKEFGAAKRELGGVDFSDLEQCALRLLIDPVTDMPTANAREWQGRLAHIFVDEYQDINAAQDAILTALSREGAEANRFMVGDAKQSIYRFRLANPKIFSAYDADWSRSGGAGRRIPLTENFRSREALIHFINHVFRALMHEDIGGVTYEALEFGAPKERSMLRATPGFSLSSPEGGEGRGEEASGFKAKIPSPRPSPRLGGEREAAVVPVIANGPHAEFHLVARGEHDPSDEPVEGDGGGVPDLLAVEREARLIARRLRELRESGHPVWDEDLGAFRPVEWRDMAVLMRSPSGRAEAFAMEFSRAGVPLVAGRDGFYQSFEISDLLNLLKLLDNPLQDIPLLAVLRSPLAGLSLVELAEIRAGNDLKPFWTALMAWHENSAKQTDAGSSGEGTRKKVAAFLAHFQRWRALVRQSSLSQCLETVMVETHYEAILLAGERGTERMANVRRLLDLARQFDPYQRQGLYRFLRFVQAQEDDELDLQPAPPPTGDAVRLMSIHKSKGLEFPVVALACVGTQFNQQDFNEPVLLNEQYGICPKITPPDSDRSYASLPYWLARRIEKRELRGEELRLLYVALTRARDTLIITGTTSQKAASARWEAVADHSVSLNEVAAARSHLDWLLMWLPGVTKAEHWHDDSIGRNHLLRWWIYDETHEVFKAETEKAEGGRRKAETNQNGRTGSPLPAVGTHAGDGAHGMTGLRSEASARQARPTMQSRDTESISEPDAGAVDALKTRMAWSYPSAAATTVEAKTSVTAIRRRAADEMDEEARPRFDARARRSSLKPDAKYGRLSATERGIAHHKFLQLVQLEQAGEEAGLRAEAARLREEGRLTPAQVGALDFGALAGFWQNDVGRRIRKESGSVRREFEFTARFTVAEVAAITGETQLPKIADEFIVVQGTADVAVLLPKEILLVDFKTDDLRAGEVPEKVRIYTPQLKLYAQALSRIHGRPVTGCWLHFLSNGETVGLEF